MRSRPRRQSGSGLAPDRSWSTASPSCPRGRTWDRENLRGPPGRAEAAHWPTRSLRVGRPRTGRRRSRRTHPAPPRENVVAPRRAGKWWPRSQRRHGQLEIEHARLDAQAARDRRVQLAQVAKFSASGTRDQGRNPRVQMGHVGRAQYRASSRPKPRSRSCLWLGCLLKVKLQERVKN